MQWAVLADPRWCAPGEREAARTAQGKHRHGEGRILSGLPQIYVQRSREPLARVDAKCGDHFLQADFPGLIRTVEVGYLTVGRQPRALPHGNSNQDWNA